MLFSKIESLILRFSWLKLTSWFEEHSLEEVSNALSSLNEVSGALNSLDEGSSASNLRDYFQIIPTTLEDWMYLTLGSSSSSWYLKWWSMS